MNFTNNTSTKYRIKQIDDNFYPQYKNWLGFWCNLKYPPFYKKYVKLYRSLYEAKQCIELHILRNENKTKVTIHEYP